MKKVILSLFAILAMSIGANAQTMKVYVTEGGNTTLAATYRNTDTKKYKVVLEESPVITGTAAVSTSAGVTGGEVAWVQLWENGPKWAVFNVGATSISDYGGYYCWGSKVLSSVSTSYYDSGSVDIQYSSDYDTAKNLWGDNWQMPKKEDFDNLLANCDVTWTTQNGMNGRLYTGKDYYSSNSVFFPAAGSFSDKSTQNQGVNGRYWSSTPSSNNQAYYLQFDSSEKKINNLDKNKGFSVRAILKE